MILGGLDIMMIVLSVLQLCVTISFCVLTGKALCKKDEDVKVLYHQHYYNNQSVNPLWSWEFQRAVLCVHDCLWFCSQWRIQNFTSRSWKMSLLVLHVKEAKYKATNIYSTYNTSQYRDDFLYVYSYQGVYLKHLVLLVNEVLLF